MSKRFILSTDAMTSEEEQEIKTALSSAQWWHWLPNFWMIKDTTNTMTVTSIRDAVRKVNLAKRCMVIEVPPPHTWAGATKPDAQGRDMTQWIRSYWDKD